MAFVQPISNFRRRIRLRDIPNCVNLVTEVGANFDSFPLVLCYCYFGVCGKGDPVPVISRGPVKILRNRTEPEPRAILRFYSKNGTAEP